MKSNTVISFVAITLAVISLGLILTREPINEQAIELAADKALSKREKQLVNHFRDDFHEMFQGQEYGVTENWNPKNIKELTAPLIQIINALEK